MTKRNPVREWTRVMEKRAAAHMDAMQPVVARAFEADAPVAPGELPSWLRRSRDVTTPKVMQEQGAETIRVLQRANALLRRRFGIDWADAAAVIFAEAQRRSTSPVALARVLTAGLRRDVRGRGA